MTEAHRLARIKSARRSRLWNAILGGHVDLDVCNDIHYLMYGEPLLVFADVELNPALPRLKRPSKTPCVVYLIADGELGKIGITADLKARLCQLQNASGRKLTLIRSHETPNAANLERALHGLLASHHQRGEWFRIDADIWDATLPKAIEVANSLLE